ncbi:amidohydrolase family protein [Halostreptopolyspora alba]|uniref:Amidohydrolase family protein n=1 Tax=Halostreptopolyspora alba TaxID=2487137 RepID=A0A3N0EHZ1_9ACTN|nr:amidohydrolase family protein [Nocardiopsaceae bacterium YIM 96095]
MSPQTNANGPFRVRGVFLPEEIEREIFVHDGVVSAEPIRGAETLVDRGWILPGLVDAHCHIGAGDDGPISLDEAAEHAETDRDSGVALIRDCGSPTDTRPLQERPDLPELIRSGRHIALPKRYIRGLPRDVEDPELLPEVVRAEAAAGDGWVKLVGDWIDREVGDLAPLWPDDVLREAIAAAHEAGARVTAHVFGEEALPGLLAAGIDCIEHGPGLTEPLIAEMARSGTALVPTLINVERFPQIAASAEKFPRYAAHMRELHAGAKSTVRSAVEAGVPVYAGTDASGGVAHGRIVDEVMALHEAGLAATDALGAASWAARSWLGRPDVTVGNPATLAVYGADPREDLSVLREPELILLRGRPFPR